MAFERKDRFFHKAKAEGFLARSAYKLDELQKKYRLIRAGDLVLDLGAAPGAWSQIAVKVVGPQGRVVGLDLKVIDGFKAPNAKFYVMDAFQFDPEILEGRQVNCLLSDMAHNTTGIRSVDQARSLELCHQVLNIADQYLVPKGHCVMKLFEGPDAEQIAKRMQKAFEKVQRFKPEAVRKGSFETYFVGLSKK
ncbi:MAG: RlmE family RNA methyltransferase [Bdellovibrionales bacterium]|nr:RlmE family RNA methyltransferase [Bdellovibrionales bacterium]